MIILDTNVLSEAMRHQPNAAVMEWLDAQTVETLFTTSVNIAEIAAGIDVLPEGKKRSGLIQTFEQLRKVALNQRILPFDEAAAIAFGQVIAQAKAAGFGIGFPDAQIAAIAISQGFVVATRDIQPFEVLGLQVINPWN
jgi:toxin FitB